MFFIIFIIRILLSTEFFTRLLNDMQLNGFSVHKLKDLTNK
jgi:hypothetical protein